MPMKPSSHPRIKKFMPIVQIDEHTIGNGRPGEGTQQLMALFKELTQKRAEGVTV